MTSAQKPPSAMFLFNYCNIRFKDDLYKDVVEGVKFVLSNPDAGKDNKFAKIYATSKTLPASAIEEGTKVALECFYKA